MSQPQQLHDQYGHTLAMTRAIQHWCTCFEMRDAEGCRAARATVEKRAAAMLPHASTTTPEPGATPPTAHQQLTAMFAAMERTLPAS